MKQTSANILKLMAWRTHLPALRRLSVKLFFIRKLFEAKLLDIPALGTNMDRHDAKEANKTSSLKNNSDRNSTVVQTAKWNFQFAVRAHRSAWSAF